MRALGRVLVLRPVGARQDAPAEADRVAVHVEDREQHPAPEDVGLAVAAVEEAEPGVDEHVVGQLQRLDQLVPALGRPAELVRAHLVAVEAPRAQVAAGRARRRRADSSRSWYQSTALAIGVDELGLALAALALVLVGVAQRDAGLAGQPLDRAREVEVLDLADEGDDVAAGAAAEAVVEAELLVDRERRRLLRVERAQARSTAGRPASAATCSLMTATMSVASRTRLDVLVDDAHAACSAHVAVRATVAACRRPSDVRIRA